VLVVFFGLIAYRIIIGFSPVVSTRPMLVFCSSSSRIGENGHESTLWGLEKRDLREGLHMEGQREREREKKKKHRRRRRFVDGGDPSILLPQSSYLAHAVIT
jgi:hypothetical protein